MILEVMKNILIHFVISLIKVISRTTVTSPLMSTQMSRYGSAMYHNDTENKHKLSGTKY